MKNKILLIGVAASAVLVGGWALAQSHGPGFGPSFMWGDDEEGGGPGMMGRMGPGMMQQHMGRGMGPGMGPGMMHQMGRQMGPGMMHGGPASTFGDPARLDALKTELAITTAQEPAWTRYAKTVQEAATAMKTSRDSVDPDAVGRMSPADRFAFMTRMREQGQKQHEVVKTAADELLAALDDGQKAKARDVLPGLAYGPGPMRGAFRDGPRYRHQDR
jgi:hypothetical protein